jgi:UDP-N-acetyl-D-mannosaminuronic acid dehydrogenase
MTTWARDLLGGGGLTTFDIDVTIVGGCGRVGLPLGLAFADRGLRVALYDRNASAVEALNAGRMPFLEPGAQPLLDRVVGERLTATTDPDSVARAEVIIVVVGTPVDEHLNPDPTVVSDAVLGLRDQLRPGQLLVLRSTLYPGTVALVERLVADLGVEIDVSFCPERIAEGKALTELFELPQIVSARSEPAFQRAQKLFRELTGEVVRLSPEEAELAKLFTNTWRYIKFATANQLFMMANEFGLDYERIRLALRHGYPRAADLPGAGFAAGPCLLKDTMQLAAFNRNNFVLGHGAMSVNEGLPLYLVSRLEQRFDLSAMTVGILGMAFKEESDDRRDSLSYKLKRILRFRARHVLCHDPYVTDDPELRSLDDVLEAADLLVVATPHQGYRGLEPSVPLIDIWSACAHGERP